MSRIRKAYQVRFRTLLQAVRARRLEQGVHWLVEAAQGLGTREQLLAAEAFERVYRQLAAKPGFRRRAPRPSPEGFWCDAGLGGLARWLRAAGYQAFWRAHIQDEELLREARQAGATVLTTDSLLLERRLLRDQVIPALWLAPALGTSAQLAQVFHEFGLKLRSPRCMNCGGLLQRADKESLRERIPPRTYRWLDEYFLCTQCGQLLWHGTHWLKIQDQLRRLQACPGGPAQAGAGPS